MLMESSNGHSKSGSTTNPTILQHHLVLAIRIPRRARSFMRLALPPFSIPLIVPGNNSHRRVLSTRSTRSRQADRGGMATCSVGTHHSYQGTRARHCVLGQSGFIGIDNSCLRTRRRIGSVETSLHSGNRQTRQTDDTSRIVG